MRAALLIVIVLVRVAAAEEPSPTTVETVKPERKPDTPAPGDAKPAAAGNPFDAFTGTNEQARTQFEEAKALGRNGDQAGACARFAASYKHEEAVSTQLNLARCRENEGKYGEAYRMFQDAARRSRDAGIEERVKVASDAAAALEPRLATVVIRLAAPIAPGTTVTVNDRLVDTAEEVRERVDPGTVVVVAKGPTGVTARQTFRIFPLNTMKVEVPTLQERSGGRQPLAIAGAAILVGGGAIALGAGSGAVRLAGGAAIAGGVALFLLAPRRRVTVVPSLVSNETTGVALVGRF
jgi:hypothetical protein